MDSDLSFILGLLFGFALGLNVVYLIADSLRSAIKKELEKQKK